ncbi:MAG: dephospho-CoA kinase [Firmicutes bacterium]|nr:dephospho-CoA kinase [Bacillota bacterium]
MIKVGLTGGIACGKSTVARMLVAKGALLLDGDQIAREIVEPGKPAWVDIVSWLGKRVLKDGGLLDRAQIASLVFSDSEALRKLNNITHPRIEELFFIKSKEFARKFPGKIQVWDIPLLFEVGMDKYVDVVLVVAADKEIQIERLSKRDGLVREEALRRIASQMDVQEKIKAADFIIYNNGPVACLQEQVEQIWDKLAAFGRNQKQESG